MTGFADYMCRITLIDGSIYGGYIQGGHNNGLELEDAGGMIVLSAQSTMSNPHPFLVNGVETNQRHKSIPVTEVKKIEFDRLADGVITPVLDIIYRRTPSGGCSKIIEFPPLRKCPIDTNAARVTGECDV